jgi:hypothetical protein
LGAPDLRRSTTAAGYDWVTLRIYRETVAALMDETGLVIHQVADELAGRVTSAIVGPQGIEP